jgi:hypothetical protein
MSLDSSMYLTIAIVAVSLICTVVAVAAGIGIPLIMRRNQQKKVESIMATGKQGEATILSLEDTGMRINDNPRIKLLLEVRIYGYPPYRVQKTMTMELIRMSQVQVGNVVQVMADPSQPGNPDKLGLLLK